MRCIGLFLLIAVFAACHKKQKKGDKLQPEIERLKKAAAFKPLNQDDAYQFINKYYLPRLDTMLPAPEIYEHPLIAPDFKFRLKNEIARLQHKKTEWLPDPINVDRKFKWDNLRLRHVKVVADSVLYSDKHELLDINTEEWHKKFGYGYMCISYPLYNPYTRRIVIRDRIEDMSFCGTDKEHELFYQQTKDGWVLIK